MFMHRGNTIPYYTLTTITTYIFEANDDNDAINLVKNGFYYINSCEDRESLEMLMHNEKVIKDYR